MFEKQKDKYGKLDKKALGISVGLMIMSWTALPIVYWLIVRKKKPMEEAKPEEKGENGVG